MSRITYDRVRITSGRFGLQSLQELHIEVMPNEHGKMWFTGIVHRETGVSELEGQIVNTVVSAVELDENGAEKRPLFSGVVRKVRITYGNGVYHMEAAAVSGSALLDIYTKSRSFQDVTMTYKDVVEEVLKDTPQARAIYTVGKDTPIGAPLIQYEETDWAFIRRLASHFNRPLIPETLMGGPRFWFGMREGGGDRTFDEGEYTVVIDGAYYTMGGGGMGWRRRDFFYYTVESDMAYEMGDRSVYKGKALILCGKTAEMRGGELYFRYRLGRESLTYQKMCYNNKVCGLSLAGTVLETAEEVVKLHLDIDEKQDAGTAYPYRWAPTTGNLMYMMPKVGTRASLCIGSRDERSAVSVNAIRTNGAGHPDRGDPAKRYLTTEHGKRMYLLPDAMGLVGTSGTPSAALMIKMEDASGVAAQSHSKLIVKAAKDITIEAARLVMNCPAQITLVQGGTSLVVNNQFDVVGAKGSLTGTGPAGGAPKGEGAAQAGGGSFDVCEQAGTILGSTPACGKGDKGGGADAAFVAAVSTVGAAKVTARAVHDASKGNPGKLMAAGAGGGAKASVTGGAPSMDPSAPSASSDTMDARLTALKGGTARVGRDMIVPRAYAMCGPDMADKAALLFSPSEIDFAMVSGIK